MLLVAPLVFQDHIVIRPKPLLDRLDERVLFDFVQMLGPEIERLIGIVLRVRPVNSVVPRCDVHRGAQAELIGGINGRNRNDAGLGNADTVQEPEKARHD